MGGINAATYSWWRNQYGTGTTASASNIETLMDAQWLDTIRGTQKPDLIVAGNNMFTYYKNALRADQRLIDWEKANTLSFDGLRYQSATVLFDPNCATKRLYGLNTKDLKLVNDPGRRWAPGSTREIQNGTYEVIPVMWSGALLTCRRESHFVINGT